ncbi:MAG TPA: sugar ABC transporter ATP-binding protein [Tepidisphaeraceae bacterium]|jgi:rhamnose transport system ATP-binding protein
MSSDPLVQIRNISKSFGGVHALSGVSFPIQKAEIHALCGENGAGKSTLIKILSGSVTPDTGEILIGGQPLTTGAVRASEQAGIAVIHQESVAFPHLSAFDNIFVGREPKRFGKFFLDRPRMRRETRALLERLGESFDPRKPLADLTVAQRQMVGIARALSQDCRLLIMDEPTASLSSRETQVLFRIIRQLQSDGVSILYVSHRLDEVFELSQNVTIFRDGKHVSTTPTNQLTTETLIKQMVGRDLLEADSSFSDSASGALSTPPLLQVRNLTRLGTFENISLDVHAGEIVGLSGLVGAGRSELARAIFGADAYDGGSILVKGSPLPPHSIHAAIEAGLALVPEDRQHLGLVLPMSVGANLSMTVLHSLTSAGMTSGRKEAPIVRQLMADLQVKAASPKVAANTLSGGNQQKLVLGKWLATKPRILILDEPTRGVDVGAKAEFHRLIRNLAAQGVAVLVISSDLPEILALSHRILVMRQGQLAGELPRERATQESILSLAIPGGAAA